MAYTALLHAYVGETDIHGHRVLPVEWVMLSRWDHDSGEVEFCVEYLDRAAEIAGHDEIFASPAEAERRATEQFGLGSNDWRDGRPTPLGRSNSRGGTNHGSR